MEQAMTANQQIPIDLSVIVPAYNAAAYIKQAIDGALSQAGLGIEIIVVDDGSTDATPEILARYGDRIRTIRQPNQGPAAARKRGIASALGAWLAFLDADDLWLPDFVRVMIACAKQAPENVAVIACGWQHVDINGAPIGLAVSLDFKRLSFERLLLGNRFPPVAVVARRSAVMLSGGFDESIYGVEDWDMWLRMALRGYEITSVPEVLAAYRQVPGSVSRNVMRLRDNSFRVLDKVFEQPSLPPGLASLRERAYGLVKIWAGANFFGIEAGREGLAEFIEALAVYPALFDDIDTYYAILCAEQPLAWKASGVKLDLSAAEARLKHVVEQVFHQRPELSAIHKVRCQQLSCQVLAKLATLQGSRTQALRYAWRGLVRRPSRAGFRSFLLTAKSFLVRTTA